MYAITSRYYDAAYNAKTLADVPFYLELAEQQGSPILELGCGTGRITLAIARAGFDVTAIDLSEPMLDVLRTKLNQDPARERITVAHGDMRTLRLPTLFQLVIIPFRALQHLHTVEDQIAALSHAQALLGRDGLLAFDVFMPRFDRLLAGVGKEIEEQELSWETWEGGVKHTVRRSFIKDSVDPLTLTFEGRFIYRTFEEGKLLLEESEPLRMTSYTYPQLQLLFRFCGLHPVAEYGSFDGKPLAPDSPEMIFVLRKSIT